MHKAHYIIGIGCRRGVAYSEIEQAVNSVLEDNNISILEVMKIVSVDLKADEAGLLEFAEKARLPICFFSKQELAKVDVPNPSEKVIAKIGTPSVSEAAAKFAGNGVLVVEKQKFGNITVAVGETDSNNQESVS